MQPYNLYGRAMQNYAHNDSNSTALFKQVNYEMINSENINEYQLNNPN